MACCQGRGSISKSCWPLRMSSPSLKKTLVSSPPIWALTAMTGLGGKPPLPGPLADGRAPLQAISARQTEMANAALIRNNNDWNSWITGYQDGGFGDWGILRTRQK